MDARKSKGPSGGAGLLFLAGLGLEVVVGVVALQALGVDAIAAAREFVETTARDLGDSDLIKAEPAATYEPDAIEPVAEPADVDAGSLSTVTDSLDASVAVGGSMCWALAEPSDAGSLVAFKLTIEPDGRVSAAQVTGASAFLDMCLEAEALNWTVPAPGQQITLFRSVRVDAN